MIIAKRSLWTEFHAYLGNYNDAKHRPAECGPIARDKGVIIAGGIFKSDFRLALSRIDDSFDELRNTRASTYPVLTRSSFLHERQFYTRYIAPSYARNFSVNQRLNYWLLTNISLTFHGEKFLLNIII